MHIVTPAISNIDMQLAEIAGIVQALLFMQEEAEAEQLEKLRSSTVSMLYIITDKVKAANVSIASVVAVSRCFGSGR